MTVEAEHEGTNGEVSGDVEEFWKVWGSVDLTDVGLPYDPKYAHVLVTREQFAILVNRGEIDYDEIGPVYTGHVPLRGK